MREIYIWRCVFASILLLCVGAGATEKATVKELNVKAINIWNDDGKVVGTLGTEEGNPFLRFKPSDDLQFAIVPVDDGYLISSTDGRRIAGFSEKGFVAKQDDSESLFTSNGHYIKHGKSQAAAVVNDKRARFVILNSRGEVTWQSAN